MLPRLRTQPSQRRYMPACTTKLSRAGELAPQPSQKDTESPNALCSLFRACVQVASVFSNTLLSVHARLRVCWDHRGRFVFGFEHIVLVTCLLLWQTITTKATQKTKGFTLAHGYNGMESSMAGKCGKGSIRSAWPLGCREITFHSHPGNRNQKIRPNHKTSKLME